MSIAIAVEISVAAKEEDGRLANEPIAYIEKPRINKRSELTVKETAKVAIQKDDAVTEEANA